MMLVRAFQWVAAGRWMAAEDELTGAERWTMFIDSLRNSLSEEGDRWPLVAGMLGVIVVLWFNLRMAHWIMKRMDRAKKAG